MAVALESAARTPAVGAFDLIVMAASAGGLAAYTRVLSPLPADFPVPIVVVQHRDPRHAELTPDLLARRAHLAVRPVTHGDHVTAGTVHVAPADRQVVIDPEGRLTLIAPDGSTRPQHRCTADQLFATAAAAHGERVIAVVLSGKLADGAVGVRAIKARGGRVLIQDPATAQAPEMPRAAIATGCIDFVLPPEQITIALTAFVMAPGAAALFRVSTPPWALLA